MIRDLHKQQGIFESNDENIQYLFYQLNFESDVPTIVFHPGNRLFPEDYEWLFYPLVENGYNVMALYQRGYGSGKVKVNDRAGLIQQQDLSHAISTVLNMNNVNSNRIGLIGHSNGAGMALRLSAKNSIIKCVVSMSMISDWEEFVKRLEHHLPDYYAKVCQHLGGCPEINPKAYKERSCIHLANNIKIPVLFISGDDDAITPTYQSTWMYEKLIKAGNKQSEFLTVQGAGHFYEKYSFSGYKTNYVARGIVSWLEKVL